MSIFEQIEDECDRLFQIGKIPLVIRLGKKQMSAFIEELMIQQDIPEFDKNSVREEIEDSEIIINDEVRVVATENDDELTIETTTVVFH